MLDLPQLVKGIACMPSLFGVDLLLCTCIFLIFQMDFKLVKIVVFVPVDHADNVREVLGASGAGHIGNYDCCSFSSRGTGRFRPLKGSKPFLGTLDQIEEVQEERIEAICHKEELQKVLELIKSVHPYEEPVIDVYPLLNEI